MLNFQQKELFLKKYLKILKNCRLFDGIEDDELLTMLSCLGARVESFDKKYTVFAEGTSARYIGIMLSGTAQIYQLDYYGNRSILSEINAGELFGEAFACSDIELLPVSIVANEPCEVMIIDSAHVLGTCQNNCHFHRKLIYNLMRDLAEKTLAFHRKIEVTSKRTTREKLLAYLNIQAKRSGSRKFDIPFDRQALADYLEVDRSGLSQEISKLRAEGLIACKKNHFELL